MNFSADKPALIGLTQTEMTAVMAEIGEPAFRARQLYQWIYSHQVPSVAEMTNLPGKTRAHLAEHYRIHPLELDIITGDPASSTRKFLFHLAGGKSLESVLIRESDRITVCVSTQVGCAVDCSFCATAAMGFVQNLSAGEIVDQVLQVQREAGQRVTNVVFMGMGEPFLNYRRVLDAAGLLNDGAGINIGARKITISTAGIVPRMREFTETGQRYKLAVSLNASTQAQREEIMPITKTHSLDDLMDAARDYWAQTRNLITFEYVLLDRLNDTPGDARRLIRLLTGLPCKVNIIPYNEIGGKFSRPGEERIRAFLAELDSAPFTVTVRWSRGTEIAAGCGQLATRTG